MKLQLKLAIYNALSKAIILLAFGAGTFLTISIRWFISSNDSIDDDFNL